MGCATMHTVRTNQATLRHCTAAGSRKKNAQCCNAKAGCRPHFLLTLRTGRLLRCCILSACRTTESASRQALRLLESSSATATHPSTTATSHQCVKYSNCIWRRCAKGLHVAIVAAVVVVVVPKRMVEYQLESPLHHQELNLDRTEASSGRAIGQSARCRVPCSRHQHAGAPMHE